MILQVLANTGQLMHHADAVVGNVFWATDAGQLKNLRRTKGACGQNDFPLGPDLALGSAGTVGHAHGAFAFEDDPAGTGIRLDREVGTLPP